MNIYDYILEKKLFPNKRSLIDYLMHIFGSSENFLKKSERDVVLSLLSAKMEEKRIEELLDYKNKFNREKQKLIARCSSETSKIMNEFRTNIISFSEEDYPTQLKKIKDIPLNLYVRGDITFDFNKSISIVGTRNVSPYAKEKVSEISSELAKNGFCVISGLARGIDGQAHHSVVVNNGKTIAVLPFLGEEIYPRDHTQLAKEILISGGALIAENYSYNNKFVPNFLKERNRIISGLSKAVLIVEGSEKSGSLSQYNHARKQGKIILTLKPIKQHEGTYIPQLIVQNGGIEIESAKEIMDILRIRSKNY